MSGVRQKAEWLSYYSRKRIVHQWTQLDLLGSIECQKILEIGPALGLVTAMLANAGYDVHTLDIGPKAFACPATPHLVTDLRTLRGQEIEGFDAILCCEMLEHLEWGTVGDVLRALRRSGAKYLVVSVPFMAFQVTFDLYFNRYTSRHYFSLKKFLSHKVFRPEPPGGHQWEVGYKGYALGVWEKRLTECGWAIRKRDFAAHCRSVFHLLEAR
jgi:2-polyprenyl-3-methyl-5-hydroxy-6-metoxy-1,4-benzoquinol methylase